MAKIDLYAKDWCDLLFEGRNKSYGAYLMRAKTGNRNNKAVLAVVLMIIAPIVCITLWNAVKPERTDDSVTTVTQLAKLEEAKVEDKHIIKKVEPKQAEPQRIKSSIKFTAPKIARDEEVSEEDELKSQKQLSESKLAISIADVKGNDDIAGKDIADIKEVITSQPDEENGGKPYDYVEQMPVFPGGDNALVNWISSHLHYPSIALEEGIEGTVMVRFVVTKSGEVGQVVVTKKVDSALDKEAMRVIRELPKFTPGRQNGKPVDVWYNAPVKFVIQ